MRRKVYIIAEAGVNHNGDLSLAKKLIDIAVNAGADAVKFQTYKTENIVSIDSPKAKYQLKNSDQNESQYEMLKRLEFDFNQFNELIDYCNLNKITFLSTPFDIESVDFLYNAGMEKFKIPSGEITNLPYLRKIGSLSREIILSTGMSTLEEVGKAISILELSGTSRRNIVVLHANTEYPTPMEDVNLKAMETIANKFNVSIGYSDHTLGIEIPIAAVALGATVIEKHFTIDRSLSGPDHKASLEPVELKNMVKAIRNIEIALGNGEKIPSQSEKKNIAIARKSIVAKRNIKPGEIFTTENITIKRPGNGLSPLLWDEILGTKSDKDYKPDEIL